MNKGYSRNILCIRSDRLGEFILTLPAIKLMRLEFPESKIYCLAQKSNIELVKSVDFIDYFLEYRENYFSGWRGGIAVSFSFKKDSY